MTRALTILNVLGVIALAVLCVFQWQRDRDLNLELAASQRANHLQFASLVEQSNTLRGTTEDLAQFKERFTTVHSELTDARAAIQKLERQNDQLLSDNGQLKTSVTNWAAAVAERDERLKEISERAKELSARLNDSVSRYNELATNYNASIRRFNDLATNYNHVVEQLNDARRAAAEKASSASGLKSVE